MKDSIRIGVAAAALSLDVRSAVAAARQMNFNGILLEAAGHPRLAELSASGRRELRHLLQSSRLELIGVRCDLNGEGLADSANTERHLSDLRKMMEVAADLGAKLVCADIGKLPEPPVQSAAVAQANLVDAALSQLGADADRYGVFAAVRSERSSFVALDRAVRSTACPWIGIDLDPVALLRDSWDREKLLSRLGNWLRHVRGRDALLGSGGRTQPAAIGAGSVQWPALLHELADGAFNGWISVDSTELPNRVAAAAAGLHYLRSLAI